MKKLLSLVFCLSFASASYADWKDVLNGAGAVLFGAGVANELAGKKHPFFGLAVYSQLAQPVIEAVQERKVTSQAVAAILNPIFHHALDTAFYDRKTTDNLPNLHALLSLECLTAAYAKPRTLGLLYIPAIVLAALSVYETLK